MANYISSNANRFYVALEQNYGQAAAITAANRFPAVQLDALQALKYGKRLDKTGSRTFLGAPSSARRQTAFQVRTYLTSWNGTGQPSYGPLFQAALGGSPVSSQGVTVAQVFSQTQFQTTAAHGLTPGNGIAAGNEIRFVTSAPNPESMTINAPFSTAIAPNTILGASVSYVPSISLPSVTLYDYWDPITAVSRMVTGAAVDTLELIVNGDYHEFSFSGPACDLLNSSSFAPGTAGLQQFPSEPALAEFDYAVVPGQLGEVWLGTTPAQFFTLTAATIEIKNNIDIRNQEFGSSYPRSIAPGPREAVITFTVFAQDDAQTTALHGAAKQRTPISAMLQLGQATGQMMAIFIPNVVPEIPRYDDKETRLQWQFKNSLAQGIAEDEIYIAFA
jgi:hypothetical protein